MVLTGLLLASGVGAVVSGCAYLANRRREIVKEDGRKAIDLATGAMSTLFFFTFAFLFVNASSQLTAARDGTYEEAGALQEIYWTSRNLPEADRPHVQQLVRDYTTEVMGPEWTAMRSGHTTDRARALADDLREYLGDLKPGDDRQRAARDEALDRVHDLFAARMARIADTKSGLPEPVLYAMIVLGLLVLVLIVFIGMPTSPRYLVMVAGVAMVMVFGMYLVVELNHPFGYGISVSPDAFRGALDHYRLMR